MKRTLLALGAIIPLVSVGVYKMWPTPNILNLPDKQAVRRANTEIVRYERGESDFVGVFYDERNEPVAKVEWWFMPIRPIVYRMENGNFVPLARRANGYECCSPLGNCAAQLASLAFVENRRPLAIWDEFQISVQNALTEDDVESVRKPLIAFRGKLATTPTEHGFLNVGVCSARLLGPYDETVEIILNDYNAGLGVELQLNEEEALDNVLATEHAEPNGGWPVMGNKEACYPMAERSECPLNAKRLALKLAKDCLQQYGVLSGEPMNDSGRKGALMDLHGILEEATTRSRTKERGTYL